MTKIDCLNLEPGQPVITRYTKEVKTVWKAPSEDPTNDMIIVWLEDGSEWCYHNEIDKY